MRHSHGARPVRRGVLRAKARVRALNDAWQSLGGDRVLPLERVRRRLEFFLAAEYGRTIAIDARDAAATAGFFRRYLLHQTAHERASDALPATDGARILLPRALDARSGTDHAIARYRVLALLQAERIARGTLTHFPLGARQLVRDLYLVHEGMVIDAVVARVPGMRAVLNDLRAVARATRPRRFMLTPAEREVERIVREGLSGEPRDSFGDSRFAAGTPADSLAWAIEVAERIGKQRHYGATRPVHHWGLVLIDPADDETSVRHDRLEWLRGPTFRLRIPGLRSYSEPAQTHNSERRLTTGRGATSTHTVEHAHAPAIWVADPGGGGERTGSSGTSAPPPPTDRPRVPPGAMGAPRMPAELQDAGRRRESDESALAPGGTQYAEWDHVTGRYRERAVTVRAGDAQAGDPAWSAGVFREHAVLIRQVRKRFEGLRASRARHGQQLDGEELDIPACVRAAVDRHMGQAPDDRLYMTARSARHPLAILLLADVSGSTKAVITEPTRMIDIEKVALLIASEALSSMGDRFALMAFAGKGPHGVRVTTLKAFTESAGDAVRQRIAALEPGGFTRLGAAVRHATAALQRESARHRLLLVLSDGRPNDADEYMSEYGVEDSRQAMAEARARGVYPFCLNVDDEGAEYLARIFGSAGYTSLRHPEQLPVALLQAVRTLIRS